MKWLVLRSLLVLFVLTIGVRPQDDDDSGDGAYGADDGGDDGYDSPADGDDDGGYDSPADGDDDLGGDESRPQPEYVSTIERDKNANGDDDRDNEQVDSSNRVRLAVLPHPALHHASLPSPHGSGSLLETAGIPSSYSRPLARSFHHRSKRSIVAADFAANRIKRSGNRISGGIVGPVQTYVRTDFDGNYRWGARHHVGRSHGRGK
ncbi:hypothetical protein BIW11_09253 [Tropilaelaps mercedesae]|uniref:Secreted protein n=1 Tax=Tropilaelaps mercedesae TaxID=418985 RepID=A0A1V9XL08_9ACAR|nr:hypothetical protein BIW11_09253 [Tropilaelaps mercedesae]